MNPHTLGALHGYDQDACRVELRFERGLMHIEAPRDGIVRVRGTLRDHFTPPRSWNVVEPTSDLFSSLPIGIADAADALTLSAGLLHLTVNRQDGLVTFTNQAGQSFAQDVAPLIGENGSPGPAHPTDSPVLRIAKAMAADEVYLGFGQRIGLPDRRGRILTNWTSDPTHGHNRSMDNLYQAHPVFMALRPGLAWGLFLNSTWFSRFDVGATKQDTLDILTHGDEFDYYLLYGPTPAEVVERLTDLVGRPALPPLWSLGYHQSRWGYDSSDKALALADRFRQRTIPLDAIHLDIDYMRGYRDFTWDPLRFPDPPALVAALRAQQVRVVTIIDPGVKYDLNAGYAPADQGLAQDVFVRKADGTPFTGYCWPDASLFPDFTRAATRAWWGNCHEGLVEAGVAGIWTDMNEPSIFERPFSEGGGGQLPMPPDTPLGEEGERTAPAEARNAYGLLMCRATYEGLRALRPEQRPWVLTRSGFTGLQRYAVAWMGDNQSWWEHLEASVTQLSSMGLGGVPHVGVDIGGYFENASGELYARWIALGAFYPFMRTHSMIGVVDQEPWAFGPRVEAVARAFIMLRYRLLPYLYTLAQQASRTGEPIFRPLSYEFPDDPATYHLHDQAMVGPHLLIAPICHPGREYRAVYLPRGRWYNFWTGDVVEGPTPCIAYAPLERIPVFVRGGAILPLGNERQSTNEPLSALTLEIYPTGESAWTVIEDDGESFAYQSGAIAETAIGVAANDTDLTVEVAARRGLYQPAPRTLGVRLHIGRRPGAVSLDGEAGEWTWDEGLGVADLAWADDGEAHRVVCTHHGAV
jgi:alpha-glucosidase